MMSIKSKKYLATDQDRDAPFGFCIEDPINPELNPGYSVLLKTEEYNAIIYEFQRAYQALAQNREDWFNIPFKC